MRLKLDLLLTLLSLSLAEGYVTFKTYMPASKQRQNLIQLTGDICEAPTGSHLIESAPEVLRGWSMSKSVTADHAIAVESLLKRLVDESKAGNLEVNPNTDDYNVMLSVWERSRGGVFAAERCEQILTTMQQLFEETGDAGIQPNLDSFKHVLLAWKNSGVPFNTHRTQRLLEWMVRLYDAGKNQLVLPDSETFDIVLQIWSRSQGSAAAENAERLLILQQKLSQATKSSKLRPTTLSFNAVLSAWARKYPNESNDWTRLTNILALMERLATEGDDRVVPDRCTYNIVLCALAKGFNPKAATEADSILRRVEDNFKAGKLSWNPDAILFNAVTGSWAHSDSTGAYRKAKSVLDRQMHLYKEHDCYECKPDVIGFTSVLSSCASEPKRQEKFKAFNVALGTFQQLEKNAEEFGAPNHVTYGTMLKACARLLPPKSPERKKWTTYFFNKCVEAGMVGGMVLGRVREAASPQEYKELLRGHSKNSLPFSWTCNVQEKNKYRRNAS